MNSIKTEKTLRCVVCDNIYSEFEVKTIINCPHCNTTVPPVRLKNDISVKLNWYEFRHLILLSTAFLENNSIEDNNTNECLQAIIRKISKLRPKGELPLTITHEFKEWQKNHPTTYMTNAHLEVIVPPLIGEPSENDRCIASGGNIFSTNPDSNEVAFYDDPHYYDEMDFQQ